VLPRIGGWLLIVGGILSRVVPIVDQQFHFYLPLDSWVTSLALILLGYALWSARSGSPTETAR
jgi:hypothetical protein